MVVCNIRKIFFQCVLGHASLFPRYGKLIPIIPSFMNFFFLFFSTWHKNYYNSNKRFLQNKYCDRRNSQVGHEQGFQIQLTEYQFTDKRKDMAIFFHHNHHIVLF